jgi:hypothetical protein
MVPLNKFLSFVLVNADSLPGWTCWNSTISYGTLSIKIYHDEKDESRALTALITVRTNLKEDTIVQVSYC